MLNFDFFTTKFVFEQIPVVILNICSEFDFSNKTQQFAEFCYYFNQVQYPHSRACKMSKVRDLPPVSGSIIWARQIDRQLSAYMRRVEDVLGKGWENHVEGQRLKADGDSFRQKLNTQELFDDWSRKVKIL